MTGAPDRHSRPRPVRRSMAACIWSLALIGVGPDQAASEYSAIAVRNMLRWTINTVEEKWFYVVPVIVLAFILWGYLRK